MLQLQSVTSGYITLAATAVPCCNECMATPSRVEVIEIDTLVERIEELEAAGRRVTIAHMYHDYNALDAAVCDLASVLGMNGDG